MSPGESLQLRAFEERVNARLDEQDEEIKSIRTLVEPSVSFYNHLVTFALALRGAGRFIKWGVGVGASITTIVLALRATGVI